MTELENIENAEIAISIANLSFGYEGAREKQEHQTILQNVSLSIEKGSFTTIIGANGCGKTTLLKLMSGLLQTSSGEIAIAGKPLASYERKELARTISVLPQSRNVPSITVEKLVEHGRFPYLGMSRTLRDVDKKMIEYALKAADIYDLRHRKLSSLSGGQRQKAYIAMTLAQDTPIILMDEPTTYLDLHHQYELLNLIDRLHREFHKTVVLVLHDMELAFAYSEQIVVLNHGQVAYAGTPQGLEQGMSDILETVFQVRCQKIVLQEEETYIVRPVK